MARILIIDDDAAILKIYRLLLEQADYEVVAAPDGEVGTRLFRAEPFDLVLTDIIMPNKEGIETIRDLTREYPDVKIIAISGGGNAIAGDTCLHLAEMMGAHAALCKPVSRTELLEAVQSALEICGAGGEPAV